MHNYAHGPMIVMLPADGWERRESCGCSVIFRGTDRYSYPCRGHGGISSHEILALPIPAPICSCVSPHALDH